jgi:signal transduction histidine kinase
MKYAETGSDLLTHDDAKLKERIAAILDRNRAVILSGYYDQYCDYISRIDARKRDAELLKEVCTPVKKRFSFILDRFIETLSGENGDYRLDETENDLEYASRFVLPGKDRDVSSHEIVKETRAFVDVATKHVLDEVNSSNSSVLPETIANIMNGLTYIVFEDLWVSSVLGFRSQQIVIQQLLSKLMKVQEEERQNFWREIHDTVLQVLAIVPLKLEIIEELSKENSASMKKELDLLKQWLYTTTQNMRDVCHGFNLFWVERKGLLFSLQSFVKFFEKEFQLPVVLDVPMKGGNIKGFPGVTLFRIIQEALFNAGRHSKATYARVKISASPKEIVTVVEDNGTGFVVQRTSRNSLAFKRYGLAFMKERAKVLKGSLRIDSDRNAGTKITLRVPSSSFSRSRSPAERKASSPESA